MNPQPCVILCFLEGSKTGMITNILQMRKLRHSFTQGHMDSI